MPDGGVSEIEGTAAGHWTLVSSRFSPGPGVRNMLEVVRQEWCPEVNLARRAMAQLREKALSWLFPTSPSSFGRRDRPLRRSFSQADRSTWALLPASSAWHPRFNSGNARGPGRGGEGLAGGWEWTSGSVRLCVRSWRYRTGYACSTGGKRRGWNGPQRTRS